MRWMTYRGPDGERLGLVVGDQIHALPPGTTMLDLLGADDERMASAARRALADPVEVMAVAEADVAPPVRPPQFRDFLCFLDHLRNILSGVGGEMPPAYEQLPAFYFTAIGSLLGPNDPVRISPGSRQFDFELEVAAIIGKGGRDIAPEDAHAHIAGFTIFCDWSARDLQMAEMALNLGPTKGKDGANTLGPALVTADELEPFRTDRSYSLDMAAFVNGEQVSSGSMDQMDWGWADIVAYASRGCDLLPGDALGSGTVPTGCLFEHAALDGADFRGWLQPGDVVRLEVEQLGVVEQEVLPSIPVHPLRRG